MELIITPTYEAMSRAAANIMASFVTMNPRCVLGLATGSTPIGLYDCLAADYEAGLVSFADVQTFNLDEYRGLAPDHSQSYRAFMDEHLFSRVDIDRARTHVPDGMAADAEEACRAYERAIDEAGGIDLQLLGLGNNGHIGFNEPDDAFSAATHAVKLAAMTRQANSRLFDSVDEVPQEAYTMGIGTIMGARNILLVVSGEGKAEILDRCLYGPIRPDVPASVLQLHPHVTVVADNEAASALRKRKG